MEEDDGLSVLFGLRSVVLRLTSVKFSIGVAFNVVVDRCTEVKLISSDGSSRLTMRNGSDWLSKSIGNGSPGTAHNTPEILILVKIFQVNYLLELMMIINGRMYERTRYIVDSDHTCDRKNFFIFSRHLSTKMNLFRVRFFDRIETHYSYEGDLLEEKMDFFNLG